VEDATVWNGERAVVPAVPLERLTAPA
jgi:hypothetical protein